MSRHGHCAPVLQRRAGWVEYSGQGRLAAFTCIRIVPPPMQVWGYGRQNPYCSGVVELQDGGRVAALGDLVYEEPAGPARMRSGW